MADKKKKKVVKKKGEKVTESALVRGMKSSKKQRAAAIKSKPKAAPGQQQQQQQQQRQERTGGLREYFKGVRIETKKVVWPTRKELISYTIVVFIACAFFGVFLWGVDTGFLAIIREVFAISMN